MKQITFKTWLFKEAMRMANTEKRSVKKILEENEYRADLYLAFFKYKEEKLINLNSERAQEVNTMIIKMRDADEELMNQILKAEFLYKNEIKMDIETKKAIAKIIKNKKIDSKSIEKNGIRYSNYYKFINNDYNSLSISKAKLLLKLYK